MTPRPLVTLCLAWLAGIVCLLQLAAADTGSAVDGEKVRGELAELVRMLDSDHFHERRQAKSQLDSLELRPELGELLATEFDRILVCAETSLEVRTLLERLRGKLPASRPEPPEEVSEDEISLLVAQLDDDSYSSRLGGVRRLEWLLANPRLVCPILVRLKLRMADEDLHPDARKWLIPIYYRAREKWLTSDPKHWDLPPVADSSIAQWIDDLVRSAAADVDPALRRAGRTAQRELWDVLVRDEYVSRVKQALEARLADPDLAPQAAGSLNTCHEITRPALVAEFWQGRRQQGVQRLLVGVPSSLQPGAIRSSHFDRIDDRVAHCLSGNNLSPGDYPVGVAIPHPNQPGALFQLVNLSTPRRRTAYEYGVKTDEAGRLVELAGQSEKLRQLSRRTLNWMLKRRRPLTEQELEMLGQLDPDEVSRFATKFFHLVNDQPLREPVPPLPYEARPAATIDHPSLDQVRSVHEIQRFGGRPSRHGMICSLLATEGTQEAGNGLAAAIAAERFLAPSRNAPYRLHWIALLAIADRDPWTEVETCLAHQIRRTDRLVEGVPDAPDVGAVAAGILLKRTGEIPSEFGLQLVEEPLLSRIGLAGYRFDSPQSRQRVESWWAKRLKDALGSI